MLFSVAPLSVLVDEPERTVIQGSAGVFVFDRKLAQCSRNGHVLSTFDRIKCIDLVRVRDSNVAGAWTVSLHRNWWSEFVIGSTPDATDASIVAAHISTATGKRVRALN